MQLNLKKIGTTLMGSVLTGATLLGGALAADISDFQKMGPSDTVVVVGASAATMDVVGAINIGAALAQHGATATSSGGASSTKVEGGANLASAKSLFINDKINEAGVTTLTKNELPTTLASKTFSDAVGTSYKYDQYIDLGQSTSQLTYGKPSGQNEPMGYVNMTSGSTVTSTAYAYKLRANFNDAINLSSTNVQGQTISLFGVDYTIGSSSTSSGTQQLVLFGSGNSAIIAEGEEASMMVGSTEHKVTIDVISDSSNAYISVDGGASTKVTNKALYTINGVDVYVNDIIYVSKTGGISKMKVSLGSGRITLKDGDSVKTGTSDTTIDGTRVAFTGTGQMSSLTIAIGAKESSAAFVKEGGEFVDPVFGTVKLAFNGYTPALDDTSRDTITVTTTGNDRATVKLTDYNSNEKSLDFATDSSSSASSPIYLKDGNGYAFHVTEGESASQNDYIVADANDASHVFQVGSISGLRNSGAKVTLKDVFTGTNYDFNLNTPTYSNGSKSIDGQDYYINVSTETGPVQLYWVAGTDLQRPTVSDAATASSTTYTTVYPGIKAKNGEKVYLTNATKVTLSDGSTVKTVLPTGLLTLWYNSTESAAGRVTYAATHDTDTSEASAPTNTSTSIAAANILVGKQYYNVTQDGTTGKAIIRLATSATSAAITAPAILVKEKKNDNSAYETIILQTTDDSTGISVEVAPTFSGVSRNGVSTATSTLTKYLDLWGTQVNYDTSGQGTVTVKVPENQVYGGVYLLTSAATAPTTTTVGSGTVVQPSLGSGISKLDTEVGADKTAKNLILVGGPAINTLVAELGTDGKSPTLEEWRTRLQGKGIVQAVSNAFATGKTAIVVAGYEKEETNAASLKLATDSTLKGAAKEVMGGVWSDFKYPLPAVVTEEKTEAPTAPPAV